MKSSLFAIVFASLFTVGCVTMDKAPWAREMGDTFPEPVQPVQQPQPQPQLQPRANYISRGATPPAPVTSAEVTTENALTIAEKIELELAYEESR